MPEIIGSKPPSRVSGYKETVVTWLNPKCQAMSNGDVPVTDGIDKALKLIEDRFRMQRLEGIMDSYTKKTPPMQQHQRATNKILKHVYNNTKGAKCQ